MLAAQYWGKKDTRTIEKIMGIAMRLSICISVVFAVMACFFPRLLMLIFTSDPALIEAGVSYLHILGIAYLFMSVSQIYLCTMRSIERVIFSTAVFGSALVINICLIDSRHFQTIRFHVSDIFSKNKVLFREFIHYSMPAFGNEVVWGVGFSMYSVIMGHLGSDMVAANSVVVVARNFGTVVCFGIASGGAILL